MPAAPRHPRRVQPGRKPLSSVDTTPQKKAGRPHGVPSTIVNLRIPTDLLAQLDRSIDQLAVQTGLTANRGMIARRALEVFLETRAPGASARVLSGTPRASLRPGRVSPHWLCPPETRPHPIGLTRACWQSLCGACAGRPA